MLIVLHSFYRPICLTLLAILGLACGHLADTVLQMSLRPELAAETDIGGPAGSKRARRWSGPWRLWPASWFREA